MVKKRPIVLVKKRPIILAGTSFISVAFAFLSFGNEAYNIGEKEAYHIRRYLIHIGRIRYYCQSRGLPMVLQKQMMEHAQWRWRTTMLLDEDTLTDHLSGGLQQSVAMFRASILKNPQIVSFI